MYQKYLLHYLEGAEFSGPDTDVHGRSGQLRVTEIRFRKVQQRDKDGDLFPMVIWSEFRMRRYLETMTIGKMHPTVYIYKYVYGPYIMAFHRNVAITGIYLRD